VNLLAVAGLAARQLAGAQAAEGSGAGLEINLFWILVSALNFLFFLVVLYKFALGPVGRMLEERRGRIEAGLRDADAARLERDQIALDRMEMLAQARREASDITTRALKIAEESRERDLAAAREELGRLREQAAGEIEAEKQRALADIRGEVADLALRAASRVVGETMTGEREQRLVDQFLAEVGHGAAPTGGSRG
jgi:F-type H+-transporting ATPase subunit b